MPRNTRVQGSRGKSSAGQIIRRAQQRQAEHPGAAQPALQETLAVPVEKADAAQRADLQTESLPRASNLPERTRPASLLVSLEE